MDKKNTNSRSGNRNRFGVKIYSLVQLGFKKKIDVSEKKERKGKQKHFYEIVRLKIKTSKVGVGIKSCLNRGSHHVEALPTKYAIILRMNIR